MGVKPLDGIGPPRCWWGSRLGLTHCETDGHPAREPQPSCHQSEHRGELLAEPLTIEQELIDRSWGLGVVDGLVVGELASELVLKTYQLVIDGGVGERGVVEKCRFSLGRTWGPQEGVVVVGHRRDSSGAPEYALFRTPVIRR